MSSLFRHRKPEALTVYNDVTDGLKTIYKNSILPIEKGMVCTEKKTVYFLKYKLYDVVKMSIYLGPSALYVDRT